MRPRLIAAGVMLAWIAASMALLFIFRGVSLRLRGLLVVGSLLLLIGALGWLKLARAGRTGGSGR